jgi:hypothetical protein
VKECSQKDNGCINSNPQPLDNFNKNKTMKDGYAYECKDCMKLYRKQYRKTQKYRESRKKWENDNPQSVATSKKKDRIKNKEGYLRYLKDYYEENKVDIRKYQNEYYRANVEKMHEKQKQRRNKKPIIYAYGDYKHRSKTKKIKFELSIEEFTDLVCSPCHYCLKFIKNINGIDRINSDIGYILSNCLPCCSICNYMKMDTPYKDFIEQVFQIANAFSLRKT